MKNVTFENGKKRGVLSTKDPAAQRKELLRVRDEDRDIRERIANFALSEAANPYQRKVLTECYQNWETWNTDYFGGKMFTPLILIAEPRTPSTFGDYATISSFGGRGQIRIRPSLVHGTHRQWLYNEWAEKNRLADPEDNPFVPPSQEQRMRFALDVLLHESIHQFHYEVLSQTEESYGGHGPRFRDQCNQIGSTLGLGRVRTGKKRGKDKALPSCSFWPHCVRPAGYYGQLRSEISLDDLSGRAMRALRRYYWRLAGGGDEIPPAVSQIIEEELVPAFKRAKERIAVVQSTQDVLGQVESNEAVIQKT